MNTEFGGLEAFLTEKFSQTVKSIFGELHGKFGGSEVFLRSNLEPLWIQLDKMREAMSKFEHNSGDSLPDQCHIVGQVNETHTLSKDEMREYFKQMKYSIRSIESKMKKVKEEKPGEYFETETTGVIRSIESFKEEVNVKFSKLEASIASWFSASDGHIKDKMRTSFSQHEANVQERLSSMEGQIKEMKDLLKNGMATTSVQGGVTPKPECPACQETFTASTWIAQCSSGHLLCWACRQRPEHAQCPTCLHPIIGRASGMESYVKILYKDS